MEIQRIPKHIIAIDSHVHPNAKEHEKSDGEYVAVAKKYFKTDVGGFVSFNEMAEMYRSKKMMCVLLGKDARTNTGLPPITNDSIAEAVRNHPDAFIGFGAVDPYMGKWAADEVHRIAEIGLRGLKFQQIFQGFFPNDKRVYPIYEVAQKLGLVVLFHMGTTGIGAGAPGGMGLRLKYGQPMHVDDVAADFPNLTIIAAHPGWPWSDEVLAIAMHKTRSRRPPDGALRGWDRGNGV